MSTQPAAGLGAVKQGELGARAGTARHGMKTVESSAVFQPKQWAEKASPEDN